MILVRPSEWTPQGLAALEPAADTIVRSSTNSAVVAGPGAGKTELLAQRVCYLLQTNLCPRPKRILAISFKRDAAKNLEDRVRSRCANELSDRFDSYTFDSFAKSLLDRFRLSLPKEWRPTDKYEIVDFYKKQADEYLEQANPPANLPNYPPLRTVSGKVLMENYVYSKPIDLERKPAKDAVEWAAFNLWNELLFGQSASRLTFPMIGRLAELTLRCSPQVLRALRGTYTHVLLDEYQDTTNIQFDLVKTAFGGSESVLTAVGDNKQRIMGWAMALPDAFTPFLKEFGATLHRLEMNYRSVPELIRIQSELIKALDPKSSLPSSAITGDGSCRTLLFPNAEAEAKNIAAQISELITKDRVAARDVCILVKQLPENYAPLLISELDSRGVQARIENAFQDLLAEPLVCLVVQMLKLVIGENRGPHWSEAINSFVRFRRNSDEALNFRRFERELAAFRNGRVSALQKIGSQKDFSTFLYSLAQFIGLESIRNTFAQYHDEKFANTRIEEAAKSIWSYYEALSNWSDAIAAFEGKNSVPIMTIHKSKGLEFHTVIFLGLEDSAFWSFKSQSYEDKCAFFVAFSRAKRNVVFTFSENRTTKKERGSEPQKRLGIGELYDLLRKCGVKEERIQ